MAQDLGQFSKVIRLYGKRVPENVAAVVRMAGLACLQTIVVATPVDTGRARSNWIVTIDKTTKLTRPPLAAGAASTAASIADGRANIDGYKPGSRVILITNNLPYIQRLNEGWSAQAPAGFVELAVSQAVEAVRKRAPKILGS